MRCCFDLIPWWWSLGDRNMWLCSKWYCDIKHLGTVLCILLVWVLWIDYVNVTHDFAHKHVYLLSFPDFNQKWHACTGWSGNPPHLILHILAADTKFLYLQKTDSLMGAQKAGKGDWSTPGHGRFTPGNDPVPIVWGWVGLRVGLEGRGKSRPYRDPIFIGSIWKFCFISYVRWQ